MTESREREVVAAFVEVANELVDDYDVVEMLTRLTMNCARLLDVASAGLLLADAGGVLHLAAASSERVRDLEVLQLQRDEGPCLDCFHRREAVVSLDLQRDHERWPRFVQAAVEAGYGSVHALPMRLRDTALGTLGLFGNDPSGLTDDDLALAQALVHVASVVIVNDRIATDRDLLNSQLQHALTSRIALEQAKGVMAHAGGLSMEDAFDALRRYARDHGRRLTEVARAVVARDLPADVLVAHLRGSVPPPPPG
ncbi:GAF and ANTAR domain-containing protein [Nocardioides litoris]|uniref:GAF and ANTAR domain-containing protein n=1 Tax=Nocardioides litoris TaxID=1926648 RepID=UPI00111F30A0|nr:GAF and ANTAR domain-containing protein [Nocardioides litoris]